MIHDVYDVQIIDEAEDDLRGIYEYFAVKRREPRFARKIYKQIMDKLNSLEGPSDILSTKKNRGKTGMFAKYLPEATVAFIMLRRTSLRYSASCMVAWT